METLKLDFDKALLGVEAEEAVKPILELFFKVKLTKTDKYHYFDFIDDNLIYYELKSRSNKYNQYPTTMVGANKVDMLNTLNKIGIFVFLFTDGLYYYKYDKTTNDPLVFAEGGRIDRYKKEIKKYCYIPINLLKRIEYNLINSS